MYIMKTNDVIFLINKFIKEKRTINIQLLLENHYNKKEHLELTYTEFDYKSLKGMLDIFTKNSKKFACIDGGLLYPLIEAEVVSIIRINDIDNNDVNYTDIIHQNNNVKIKSSLGSKNLPTSYKIYDKSENILTTIPFREGSLLNSNVNGITEVDLINILIDRFEHIQESEFKTDENRICLEKMREIKFWIEQRVKNAVINKNKN